MTVLAPAASPTIDSTHTVRSLAIVAGFGWWSALGLPWLIDAQVSRQLANGRADSHAGNEDTWALSDGLTLTRRATNQVTRPGLWRAAGRRPGLSL